MGFHPSPGAAKALEEATRQAIFDQVATPLANKANELAPDGTSVSSRRPAYASRFSFKVRFIDGRFVLRSIDPNAHIVEFGSITSPEYAPVRRAVRALGLTLRDFGKGGTSRRRGLLREFADD